MTSTTSTVTPRSSALSGINVDLIVPVLILFILLRIKSVYNIAQLLLKGLRFFTPAPASAPTATTSATSMNSKAKSADEIIERSLAKLQVTMLEVDNSVKSKHLLESQLLYTAYEVLVNLSVSSFLGYLWSVFYHSVAPGATQSCWVVLLLIITTTFSIHCLLQIIYLTGTRAVETKLAALVGCCSFALNLVLFFLRIHVFSNSLTEAIGAHFNALLLQLSPSLPRLSYALATVSAQIVLSLGSAVVAAATVFPAVRFGQTFCALALTRESNKVTTANSDVAMRSLLWFDLLLPLAVALACSPLPYFIHDSLVIQKLPEQQQLLLQSQFEAEQQSLEGRDVLFESVMFCLQAALVATSVAVRISCMKAHLQCFLDSLVKTVSEALMMGQDANIALLHQKVQACTSYLIAAAAQYLANPVMLLCFLMLLHKSSPLGTGISYAIARSLDQQQQQQQYARALLLSIQQAMQYNSTAAAVALADAPYFSEVFNAMLGSPELEAVSKAAVADSSHLLSAFASKVSRVYFLPAFTAAPLCRGLLCVVSLQWFFLYAIGILLWKKYAHILLRTTSQKQKSQ